MLAGCSSALVSPRHRLRSEASSTQFQACHIPAMSTQRLDLPRSFGRKETSRPQPVRPVGITVEKPIESKGGSGCSLRQNIKLPPVAAESRRESRDEFWERSKSLKKRYAAEVSYDEGPNYMSRVKRKRGNGNGNGNEGGLGQFSSEGFWFHAGEEGEERVCFVPGGDAVAPPLPPLSNIPWFDSVVTEITDFGKSKDVETVKGEASGSSSTSSGGSSSRRLALGLSGNPRRELDIGNPSGRGGGGEVVVAAGNHNGERSTNYREHEYMELISLVVACVEQIGSKNIAAISHCLARLGELASPRGSPVHRLTAYYTEALALRVARLWPHIFHIAAPRELDHRVDDDNGGTALRLLNQVTPIPKFIHFTSNEILLKAFEGKDRVHIIDFDLRQGLQWPSLFQSLASRTHPPSHVRITGIGESKQELIETGDRLAGFAEAFNLPFEFHPVVDRLEDVRLWMLHVKERETVAVNCVLQLHKMLYDGTGATLRDFLRLIRSTNAELVVMAEQEAAHNEATLDARLVNSLKYYSAIFDSIDSSLPLDSAARMKIEEVFAREVRNIIACEGRDRVERHETFEKWQQLMEQGGFRCRGISEREVLQGQMMMKMYSSNENYRVELQHGSAASSSSSTTSSSCLTLRWSDQPLYAVSAWTPGAEDVAGGSLS